MQERGRRVDGVLARERRVRGGARALSEPWQRDFAARLWLLLFVGGRCARRGRGARGRRGGGGRCLAITGGGHGGGGGGQSYHHLLRRRRQTTKDGVEAAAASCLQRAAAGALPSPSHLHTKSGQPASSRSHHSLSRAAARRSMPPSHSRRVRAMPLPGQKVPGLVTATTWIVTLDRTNKRCHALIELLLDARFRSPRKRSACGHGSRACRKKVPSVNVAPHRRLVTLLKEKASSEWLSH